MVCLPLCIYIGNTNENDICKEVTFFVGSFVVLGKQMR